MSKDNTGDNNSGDCNSGNWNSGYRNSGDCNSGNWNSGNWNSGNCNSGDWNSGNCNSGNWNSGNCNSGDWNSGDRNSGAFNRDTPKMRLFETDLDMTVTEFYKKYDITMDIPLNTWVDKSKMTDTEKKEISGWETMGGYLKTLDFKEACVQWWNDNPNDHERFLTLPHFNAEIFKDITGIDTAPQPKTIEIGGKTYEVSDELTEALKKLKEVEL